MLITVATKRTVEELTARVPEACKEHGFGVLGTIDLRAKLIEKGQPCERAALVFEVCRPDIASRALAAFPEVAAALPCRIAVVERKDGTRALVTIRPGELLALTGATGLAADADAVETSLRAILATAAG